MNSSSLRTLKQILLIDSQVEDLDKLIAGVQIDTAVYVLHPQENGIEQITTILQQHSYVETVYLVAHGKSGCLYLGNSILNQETLPTFTELLKNWQIGQLLIYACNVADGETGEAFLQSLHHYTKAKIAASSHPIGQTEAGQNWQLNKTTHPIEIQPVFNPEVMASYSGMLAAGDLDTSFGGDGKVTTDFGGYDSGSGIAVQSDGKILVVSTTDAYNYEQKAVVVRYNSNGSLDTTFSGDGKVITDLFLGNSIAVQSDGKIVVAGKSYSDDFGVVRYNSNGSLDTTFSEDGLVTTDLGSDADFGNSIAVQPDGKIVVAGSSFNGRTNVFAVVRYNSNGSLDTTFSEDGKLTTNFGGYDFGSSVAVQSDGKIVVAGSSDSLNGKENFAVVRYSSNGSLDTTFSEDGKLTTDLGSGSSMAIQSDGKIVVAGSSDSWSDSDFAVVRYNINGSFDTTFSGDGKLTTKISNNTDRGSSVAVQSNGKIVVAGFSFNDSNSDFAVVRYNSNGSLDTTFSSDGKLTTNIGNNDFGGSVAVQTDGKIIVGGFSWWNGSNTDVAVVRYEGDSIINGTANNDILTGTASPDVIKGLAGNDLLIGQTGTDQLLGGKGNDSLKGSAGNDTLTGGGGADKFIYSTNKAFSNSPVGVDTITDFTIAQGDKIVLDKTTFPKINSVAGTGFSINTEFAKVTTSALAATSSADIVYNTSTGGLFYNPNGTATGFGTGGKFLTLTNKPALTENQFLIQA